MVGRYNMYFANVNLFKYYVIVSVKQLLKTSLKHV